MTERQIELVWKCTACGVRNLGRFTICQNCGDPKDDSEEYEMPADTSATPSVTDPALLRMATAAPNWSCKYCGSAQRAYHRVCERCGAALDEAAPYPAPMMGASHFQRAPSPERMGRGHTALVAGGLALFLGTCGWAFQHEPRARTTAPLVSPSRRTEFTGVVEDRRWTRTVTVQRWQLVAHEGFRGETPPDAVSVRAAGSRVHHHEDVFDHNETVYVDVEVPDGYETESYTERVKCGEDCTTTPRRCRERCSGSSRSCREVCTNSRNGFASCRTVCSGGDKHCWDDCSGGKKSCETKYCDKKRTRQIPKTRTEKRAKVEARYRSVPRYAPWVKFQTWEWVDLHKATSTGIDESPFWPELDVDAGAKNAPTTRPVLRVSADGTSPEAAQPGKPRAERELHAEVFDVTFRTDDGRAYHYVPATAEEFATFPLGASRKLTITDEHVVVRP